MKISFRRLVLPAISTILVSITVVVGIACSSRIPDCGLADIHKVTEIPIGVVNLSYAWGDSSSDEEWMEKREFAMVDGEYEVLSAPVVARVGFTGNIRTADDSLGQEITVKEVLRGAEFLSEGQTCYCYQSYGFQAADGGIEFLSALNMMNTEDEYIVFMEPSPLNPYTQEKAYLLSSPDFPYIKIGGEKTPTLPEDYKSIDFLDLQDYEFFSSSERCTAVLNEIRREILAEFGY